MNRREFLKVGSAAIAAATFPKIAATATPPEVEEWKPAAPRMGQIDPVRFWAGPIPAFRPEMEYGNGIHLTARPTPEFGAKLVELLYEDMRRHIPPGYRSKVEIVGPRPIDYGRAMGISWRYRP